MIRDQPRLGLRLCLRFLLLLFLPVFLGLSLPAGAAESGTLPPVDTPPIWRQALGGAVVGSPSVQGETVTVVCDGGNLQSYTRQGTFLWSYFARGKLSPFVSRSPEGTSYICRTNGLLIAVNRAGRELWRINLRAPLSSPVIVGWDGRIFVNTRETLRCYTASGYLLWRLAPDSAPVLPPVPDSRGGLLVLCENNELLEIDAFGGFFSRILRARPALILPLAFPEGSEEGQVLLIYENGGVEISRRASPPAILPALEARPLAAAVRGTRAAVTLATGRVVLIDAAGGRHSGIGDSHIRSGTGEEVRMLYDERGIYVLSKSGASGFTGDGKRLWLLRLEGASETPAFGDDGILYAGGIDWVLHAYRMEDRVREQKRSLYGPLPEGSYGTANPLPSPWADYYFRFEAEELDAELGRISRAIREGQVGTEEKNFVAYLMEVSASPGANPVPAAPVQAPVRIRHRVEAVRLLGYIGSRETIGFLAERYFRDRDALVKAAAAEAIGRIGVDPNGAALKAFTALIFPPIPYRDEQVLAATASATAALCRFSGPPLSDMGIKLLVALAGEDRPRVVQDRARRELASLR
ncbi:MAG: PQQ-like beta-propeller repeat protein [Spirochaetaceae bacterium]|jgi:outer membrane protein assembly factor BamB|nr:PQQ-like beta-propeller repeat protein [Spirochaetaceae bacterium]